MKCQWGITISLIFLVMATSLAGCFEEEEEAEYPHVQRESKIPEGAVKMTPETDDHPPVLHSDLFNEPVPLPHPVNTAGGEDSPFITEDGLTLYFFFTPDVDIPAEKQLLDDVTGIYRSKRMGNTWSEPERVWLQDPGKLALDGAVTIEGDRIWFASAREGYTGVNLFTADREGDHWNNWRYAGDRLCRDIKAGEMHILGDTMYFHSDREGGEGKYDIWTTVRSEGTWTDPVNLDVINSPETEGWPYVSGDAKELWFLRTYMGSPGIFRSVRENDTWGEPELILSSFAGEPSLDREGNLYFVHHYYRDGDMIEADIYLCTRK